MQLEVLQPEGAVRRVSVRVHEADGFSGIAIVDADTDQDLLTLFTSKNEWFVVADEPVTVRQPLETPAAAILVSEVMAALRRYNAGKASDDDIALLRQAETQLDRWRGTRLFEDWPKLS
jgi:hypothetical protein